MDEQTKRKEILLQMRHSVNEAIRLDQQIKADTKKLDAVKAEIQAAALQEMENKKIKQVTYYGTKGSCVVGYKAKLDISNLDGLKSFIGSAADKIKVETSIKYTPESKLKEALIALYQRDYVNGDIPDILTKAGLDAGKTKTVIKKLKGDYWKDRKTLESAGLTGELEEETDAIRQILNYELIDKFFGDVMLINVPELKRTLLVDESLSVGLNYESD